ncbi:MAG: ThuA domain-containing protein [Gemmatimonadota bacterium]|nr:ThuA domain-containing protein [Gemmatimonadota bacterium]MDH3422807.1 ThuA domain-containing protein [Gemmatimonadota bacterium]
MRCVLAGSIVAAAFIGTLAGPTAAQQAPKRLLMLTHAGLYKHTSLGPAEAAVTAWGRDAGFEVTTLQGYLQDASALDLSVVTAQYLAGFDGIMMMTNGNLPMDQAQRRALTDFVRNGGGFIGVHNAALTFYDYPEFGEMLGGYFRRAIQQNHVFVLRVEDQDHPATRMLGSSWPIVDELYHYGTAPWSPDRPEENIDVLFDNRIPMGFSRDRVRVLMSIDTRATDIEGLVDVEAGGDYPQSWVRRYGQGRSFYTSLGHRDDIWTNDSVFRAHVVGGIRWALGLEEGDATPRGAR